MKVKVEPWTEAGAVSIQVEQLSAFGDWVSVLDTTVIGTYPSYTTTFTTVPQGTSTRYRYRWETSAGSFTGWLTPTLLSTPTAEETERFTQAVIQKATRFYLLTNAPYGHHGVSDFGPARVLDDRQIEELLYGLRFREWDIDLTSLVTAADVIRVGLQSNDADFGGTDADIERAIDAAVSWIADRVLYGAGIA